MRNLVIRIKRPRERFRITEIKYSIMLRIHLGEYSPTTPLQENPDQQNDESRNPYQ